MDYKIEGVRELEIKLGKLARKVTPSELETILWLGAKPIENDAVRRAPIDTGTLRRSIHTETQSVKDGAEARIGTNVEYAKYQEFGTSRMRAQPYLRPAFDANKREAIREIQRALKALVKP